MKIRFFSAAWLIVFLFVFSGAMAQELTCKTAIKKDDKACKKDSKIHKKMFHDRPYSASRKQAKADKKECKAGKNEFFHHLNPNHDGPAAQ